MTSLDLIQKSSLLCRRYVPLAQFQRFRGKINIQRPQQPHYERARVVAVTQPVFPEVTKASTCFQRLNKSENLQSENPYNDIVAREVHNWLVNSRMVVVFHLNSISADEVFRLRVQLHKQNMHLKSYGKKIIAKAVANTRFEAILPLFESNHCIIFSPDQRISTLLRLTRKVPQMILLGGIIEDAMLSRNELVAFAQLPSLPMIQAGLVQNLETAAGKFVQLLACHQNFLVNALDTHAKQNVNDLPSKDVTRGNDENV